MNKFNEIFLDLEQKILAKEYPPHSLLPSENQLIKICLLYTSDAADEL